MANHLRTELVLEALNMALWQRRPGSVVHHSDQGRSRALPRDGRRTAMGSVGDCFDNAMAGGVRRTQAEARMAIFEYIEGWCHSGLGYLSPLNFERSNQQAA